MPQAAHPVRGRSLDPARDRTILDAAEALLGEVGYDRMTVDAVARRAGVGKATIYRRWTGKAAMVAALVDRLPLDHVPWTETGSLRADLVAALTSYCRVVDRKRDLVRGLVPAMGADPALGELMRLRLANPQVQEVDALLARAVERGELAAAPSTGPLLRLAKALVWHRVLLAGEPLDDEFVVQAVDSLFLPLLRSPAHGSKSP